MQTGWRPSKTTSKIMPKIRHFRRVRICVLCLRYELDFDGGICYLLGSFCITTPIPSPLRGPLPFARGVFSDRHAPLAMTKNEEMANMSSLRGNKVAVAIRFLRRVAACCRRRSHSSMCRVTVHESEKKTATFIGTAFLCHRISWSLGFL